MTSRTPEGKHTKRFIILKRDVYTNSYTRSQNIPEAFPTREEAQTAIDNRGSSGVTYKIRQK